MEAFLSREERFSRRQFLHLECLNLEDSPVLAKQSVRPGLRESDSAHLGAMAGSAGAAAAGLGAATFSGFGGFGFGLKRSARWPAEERNRPHWLDKASN